MASILLDNLEELAMAGGLLTSLSVAIAAWVRVKMTLATLTKQFEELGKTFKQEVADIRAQHAACNAHQSDRWEQRRLEFGGIQTDLARIEQKLDDLITLSKNGHGGKK